MHATSNPALEALGGTLRRELDAARERVEEVAERRHRLERELDAARAAEAAERQALHTLQAIVREAATVTALARDTAPTTNETAAPAATGAEAGAASASGERAAPRERLAGAALRRKAVSTALRRARVREPIPWREWLAWMRADGFEPAGRKPDATFLTQLARSPLVRRSPRAGVYLLDPSRLTELREQLDALHAELSELPPPSQLALLGDSRARRRALQTDIARVERTVEEAWELLSGEPPPAMRGNASPEPQDVVDAWLNGTPAEQPRLDDRLETG